MLHITFSNRSEVLLKTLLERLRAAPASPFTADEIIIPSAAMRRHVDMAITDHFGICANVRFSFLARWLWTEIGTNLPAADLAPLSSAVWAWRILALFGDATFVAAHPRLVTYLSGADAVMQFDLASRTAALFEQYTTYRPDWIDLWSKGELAAFPNAPAAQIADQQWQSALWQRILLDTTGTQQTLSPAILHDLRHALASAGPDAEPVRARAVIHVFCLPTNAPVHLEFLRELGRRATIELYVLNPCREYWFDVVDRRRLTYLALQGDLQHHDVGNQLLAAWGKQTQAQIDLLLATDAAATVDDGGFVVGSSGPTDSLLAQLQDAILNLTDLAPASIVLDPADRSIECHVCHSMTRELDVLQDQLLALFAAPDAPSPSDIVVVTPNLEDAAALIDTVFGSVPFNRRIPYTITGRAASQTNVAARALIDLLALASSRMTASAVFALLQQPVIGRQFGFGTAELDVLHGWLGQSGIRWGMDAAHRARTGVPESDDCTFEDGLHRLFLGYALPATVTAPFAGRVPAANIEGGDAAILGRFWHCMQMIRTLQHDLDTPREAADWHPYLNKVLDTFLAPDSEQVEQIAQVRDSLRELHDQWRRADLTGSIPVDVIRSALAAQLDESAHGGVPTGTVTFCGMSSLRSLPYRVVCAIGLGDGAFPGAARPLEFDLMTAAPRAGDRQRGSDDRNLFLDLILAARSRLYLSYTGRGIRDNAPLPPSVLVADLLDYLVPAIASDAHDGRALATARARLLVQHPLQPFSSVYFSTDHSGDHRLTSSNDEYCAALQHALQAPVGVATTIESGADSDTSDDADEGADDDRDDDLDASDQLTFFSQPLAEPDAAWHDVSAAQLKKFLRNPCRYLLKERLHIRLADDDDTLQDDEPFLPDFKGVNALAARLQPLFEQGSSLADIAAMAEAGNELPPGPMGDKQRATTLMELAAFTHRVVDASAATCLPPHQARLAFDLDGTTWALTGGFSNLRPDGLVLSRFDEARAGDYLDGWIDHLLLNATLPAGVTGQTTWIAREKGYGLRPCENAKELLHDLLQLYRRGLQVPLHFFPKSAWAYIKNGESMYMAGLKWHNAHKPSFGESQHVAYQLALRGIDNPLDDGFESEAKLVFDPLVLHLTDLPS